jgi:thiamine biosynthesis lipoprotein
MACTFEVFLALEDPEYGEKAARAVFEEIDRLELELSRYVPHSDIARIASLREGESLLVGPDALECLLLAAEISSETGGAFDVTYASRSVEGGAGRLGVPAREPVLALDPAAHEVRALREGVAVDLGGIGKGYALDRAAERIRDWKIDAALLHAGKSTVLAVGSRPGSGAWPIGLRLGGTEGPGREVRGPERIELRDAAASGSGRTLRGDHVVDPRSGRAAKGTLAAWAVAPSAARADALTTAFLVLGVDEVRAYCEGHPGISAAVALGGESGAAPALVTFGCAFR